MSIVSRVREFMPAPRGAGPGAAHVDGVIPVPFVMSSPIDVRQDQATKMMVAFFGIFIVLLLVGLFVGEFAKQEAVRGYVSSTTGLTRVLTPRSGTVETVAVAEGETVEAGQVILSVAVTQVATGGTTTTEVERQSLESRLATIRDELRRIEQIEKQVALEKAALGSDTQAVLSSLDAQEKQVKIALAQEEEAAARFKKLVDKGLATRDRLDGHRRTAMEYGRQLTEIGVKRTEVRRMQTERQRTIDELVSGKTGTRATLKNEALEIEARLGEAKAGAKIDIVAPRSGKLSAITVGPGASVNTGDVVAAIGDGGAQDLVVILDAPSSAVGLIQPGQRVVLKYDAFPYKTFGIYRGTVHSVSSATSDDLNSAEAKKTRTAAAPLARVAPVQQSTFRIMVKPDQTTVSAYGVERPIQLGSTLTADIVVERRRLIDWVIDPILAMRGRS